MSGPEKFMDWVRAREPSQPEFHQAVREVVVSLWPFLEREGQRFLDAKILERMVEPARVIRFRVTWLDDQDVVRVSRGWRFRQNGAIVHYEGGLSLEPTVAASVLKLRSFGQMLKNWLTTLTLGGAKGGAVFDPKDKSDKEVTRLC